MDGICVMGMCMVVGGYVLCVVHVVWMCVGVVGWWRCEVDVLWVWCGWYMWVVGVCIVDGCDVCSVRVGSMFFGI